MQDYLCVPENYKLRFEPNLENFTFEGEELLTFRLNKQTEYIYLDSSELSINNCLIIHPEKIHADFFLDSSRNLLKVVFAKPLKKGVYCLSILFSGVCTDGLSGWYKSRYEVNKKNKYLITTHFEPADARKVFPCADNPALKATFDVSLLIDEKLTAISNMPVQSEKKLNNKKLIEFMQSPKMSTYLLYLGVGEFEIYEETYNSIKIRGITTPEKSLYTKFAVQWTKKCLSFYEDYFNQPFVLPKLDLIAIPDFAAGAMEQWGAITFRENLLLYYEKLSSVATKQNIAEVVAHELVHQWFGNLVTMKWWNDLWLNESFATYMAYKALDHYFPTWNIWSDYITGTVFSGMDADALQSSHPIQVNVKQADDVNELFDEIAYDKGGSILRMLEEYVGSDYFRDGLRNYIANFKYSNTIGEDLWNSIEKISKKNVAEIMRSFIRKQGFPLIQLKKTKKTLNINQTQFLFLPKKNSKIWSVPLVFKTDLGVQRKIISDKKADIQIPQEYKYINANLDYSGFYATEYDEYLSEQIGEHFKDFSYKDKLGILHDQYLLTISNRQSLKSFTSFADKYISSEVDSPVLNYLIGKLSNLMLLVSSNELKQLVTKLSEYSLKITGFTPVENENPHINYLRNSALYSLSLFDHPRVREFALESFKKSLIDKTSLHPDLKGIIYALAVWSDDIHYEVVLSHYRYSNNQEEKAKFLSALGNSKNKQLIDNTLSFALSSEVRFAQILYLISGISRNPHGINQTLNWLMENWTNLQKKGGGMVMILRYLLKIIIPVCGVRRKEEVLNFLDKQKIQGLEETYKQVREGLIINSKFVSAN